MGELFDATGQMGKQGAFQAGHSIESKKCSERKVKYYYALKGGHPIPYHHTRSSKHYQLHPKVTKGGRLDPPPYHTSVLYFSPKSDLDWTFLH